MKSLAIEEKVSYANKQEAYAAFERIVSVEQAPGTLGFIRRYMFSSIIKTEGAFHLPASDGQKWFGPITDLMQ